MNSADIREAFLSFFESKNHTIVPSSSLVPGNDPTLLFTNAGMVQFKDVFLGDDKRDYSRATSSQRCVRAGGKHNDLENVGYTARHHTFFEMLGNFSFGDYFKRDAIYFAWEFLTQVLKLPPEKLWVTVHISDDEAADIWINDVGVSRDRFSRLDEDNFWQMGDTGPCGPSSEIFYDHGADIAGGPPGSENDDLDRYIEIWNLVFMQYERQSDGTLVDLPKPSVDTGMGLERVAAVMQQVHNNYDIDLFQHLLKAAAAITGVDDLSEKSLRVIADHIRSCAFLITDGVLPSNEGRGYVLRRIIRRALRHGHKLGCHGVFFHQLVGALAEVMGEAYPELITQQAQIEKILLIEEQQFAKTLEHGLAVLESALKELTGDTIPGSVVFALHDTYGFPTDLTNDIAREKGYQLDIDGYETAMAEQRARARAAGSFKVDYSATVEISGDTKFLGYDTLTHSAEVVALLKEGAAVDQLLEGDEGVVVLAQTPFYAESGGQVGDTGYLSVGDNRFEVLDCQKQGNNHLHIGRLLSGALSVGDQANADVDHSLRQATVLNHSATHLLHAALRKILGEHVTQKGSLVDSEKLRFDFSHFEAVTPAELAALERCVNDEIRRNSAVTTDICSMEEANTKGAMMLFGEKYGDEVRVLSMGDGFSVELCGGTHVQRTGDLGVFRIVSESGTAAGVRRIEAVTGQKALDQLADIESTLNAIAQVTKANTANVVEKVEQLLALTKTQEKSLAALQAKMASAASGDLLSAAQEINGVTLVAEHIENTSAKALMGLADSLKSRLQDGVFLLAGTDNNKVALIAGVSKSLTDRYKAGDLIKAVAPLVGGKGGGKPELARGAGDNVNGIDALLKATQQWVAQ